MGSDEKLPYFSNACFYFNTFIIFVVFKNVFELRYDKRLASFITSKFNRSVAVAEIDNQIAVEFFGRCFDDSCQNFLVGLLYFYWYLI